MINDPTRAVFPGMDLGNAREQYGDCGCWTCVLEHLREQDSSALFMPFIVCPRCGNKRCPKATFHENDCTDSNAPGQQGSRYE